MYKRCASTQYIYFVCGQSVHVIGSNIAVKDLAIPLEIHTTYGKPQGFDFSNAIPYGQMRQTLSSVSFEID